MTSNERRVLDVMNQGSYLWTREIILNLSMNAKTVRASLNALLSSGHVERVQVQSSIKWRKVS